MTDLKTFLDQHKDTVFRYWTRLPNAKQSGEYSDIYIDEAAHFGKIVDAILLPNGDVRIAFTNADGDDSYVEYERLSEIDFAIVDTDQEADDDAD